MEDIKRYEFDVIKFLFNHPHADIESLVNSIGIYPEYIIEAIDSLTKKKYAKREADFFSLTKLGHLAVSGYPFYVWPSINIAAVNVQFDTIEKNMPHGHPQQYQYWFNSSTCEKILRIAVEMMTSQRPRLAFIGSPLLSLYFHLAFPEWPITVIDISEVILEYLRPFFHGQVNMIIADVRQKPAPLELGIHDVVFIDPPFYPDYYRSFLGWANSMQNDGGLLFAVLFGTAVKGNNIERKIVMDEISKHYVFIKSYDDLLKYSVPRFEKHTYRTKLPNNINISDWRQNTLGVFSKCIVYAEPHFYEEDDEWIEYKFGKKRIIVRKQSNNNSDLFFLRPLSDNSPILTSVSRKNPDRQSISLWTSDNEVYTASKSALNLVHAILREMGPDGIVQDTAICGLERMYGSNKTQEVLCILRHLSKERD